MIASLITPAAVVAAFCTGGATASGSSYFTGAGLKGKVSPGTVAYGGAYYGPYYSGGAVAPVRHSDCGPLGVCESCDHYGHKYIDEGKSCSDGLYCNGEEHCDAYGKCVSGTPVDCSTVDFPYFSDQCGEKVCSEKYHKCTIETHAGECDDHDSCTIIDTCKIVDGSCSGTPRRCPFPCHTCSAASGECEYMCTDDHVCEHDTCVYAPHKEPECHAASDCPDPGCQECHHGYCKDAMHKDTCTCPPDACRGCEECKVMSLGGYPHERKTHCDPTGCCNKDKDCPFTRCQSCTDEGFCVDALDKNSCRCNERAVDNTCRSCETCVVTSIDATMRATTSFDCIDEDFECCTSDHDCAFPACQTCSDDGVCQDAVHKDTCTCPDDNCGHCKECSVHSIEDAHAQTVHTACTWDESCDKGCDEEFDVFCYKCGSEPLSCLVTGYPGYSDLHAIHEALQGDCDASTQTNAIGPLLTAFKPKTSAGQQCKSGFVTAAASMDHYGKECLHPMGDHMECPLVDDRLHNVGRYKVCLTHGYEGGKDVAKVVNDAEEKSELICGGPHHPCHVSDCPAEMPQCSTTADYCPEPTYYID